MRIVGGNLKGRTLFSFEGEAIRPTPDKVREAFFNIIQSRIYGKKFIDLFSGTGAMGIEAFSRGAIVTLNDSDKQAQILIKKNLEKLKIVDGVRLFYRDGVKLIAGGEDKYDIIYIDPPYKAGLNEIAVSSAIHSLERNGIIVLESEVEFNQKIDGLEIFDSRKYGRVKLTFFRKEGEDEE